MISRIYRLMDTKRIELKLRELIIEDNSVLVRPEYLAICAADQRYYLGQRRKEVLREKLPLALIHEATGIVLKDYTNNLPIGSRVAMVPLDEVNTDSTIKSNYVHGNSFVSSDSDGFMRDLIVLPSDRVVPFDKEFAHLFSLSEVVSVAINALEAFDSNTITPKDSIGVWGDGSMGFVMGLSLRYKYPDAKIYIFGKQPQKLLKFSYAEYVYSIDDVPPNITVNHGFECVGGQNAEQALEQMIELTNPQGTVNMLGVSENTIGINTRLVLEKGLRLLGHSRSSAEDFRKAVSLIENNRQYQKYLQILISEIIEIKSEDDIYRAFDQDVLNDFKTVMKWAI